MDYCSQADIEAEFKNTTFDTTTAVKAAELALWINQESQYIDGRIGLRFVVPVNPSTYPEAGAILKRIAIFRVSERVKNKLEVKSNVTQALASDEKYIKNVVRTPNDDLDMIAKGLLLLQNVPLISSSAGVGSFNSENGYCHVFDVAKQQW